MKPLPLSAKIPNPPFKIQIGLEIASNNNTGKVPSPKTGDDQEPGPN